MATEGSGAGPRLDDSTRVLGQQRGKGRLDEYAPGDRVGDYVVERTIAAGGFGTVYAADDVVRGRKVALKVLHRDLAVARQVVQRFALEARLITQLRHPHIVEVFESGELGDGRPFYTMELLEETTLRTWLLQQGRISPAEALALLEPIGAALGAAHRAGIVHRDLKAGNIALGPGGEPSTVKLLDFGIAKLLHPDPDDAGLTVAGQRLGTAPTMAPEQIRGGRIGPATDVYALGVMLHQMLTGRYPFETADALEMERLHLEAPAPRPSQLVSLAPAVDAVVLRCLEKEPGRRFPSVLAIVEALRAAVGGAVPGGVASEGGMADGVAAGAVVAPERGRAVALLVEVRGAGRDDDGGGRGGGGGTDDDDDDDELAALATLLDTTEQELTAAGFALPVATAGAVLGVRIVGDDDEARTQIAVALALAGRLLALVGELGGERLPMEIGVHVGDATMRGAGASAEVVGGPVTRFRDWMAERSPASPLTPGAARLLGDPARAPSETDPPR